MSYIVATTKGNPYAVAYAHTSFAYGDRVLRWAYAELTLAFCLRHSLSRGPFQNTEGLERGSAGSTSINKHHRSLFKWRDGAMGSWVIVNWWTQWPYVPIVRLDMWHRDSVLYVLIHSKSNHSVITSKHTTHRNILGFYPCLLMVPHTQVVSYNPRAKKHVS